MWRFPHCNDSFTPNKQATDIISHDSYKIYFIAYWLHDIKEVFDKTVLMRVHLYFYSYHPTEMLQVQYDALPILQSQYLVSWWPVDARIQVISSHGIVRNALGPVLWGLPLSVEYPSHLTDPDMVQWSQANYTVVPL